MRRGKGDTGVKKERPPWTEREEEMEGLQGRMVEGCRGEWGKGRIIRMKRGGGGAGKARGRGRGVQG